MTEKIYFEPVGTIHSGFWDLINYPPPGYSFVVPAKTVWDMALNNPRTYSSQFRWNLEKLLPLNLTMAWLRSTFTRVPGDIALTYAYNHVSFRNKPWLVHAEFAHPLVGRGATHFTKYKRLVERRLSSQGCKAIIVASEIAKKSILLNFDFKCFEEKIFLVPQAVPEKNFVKREKSDGEPLRLLFVGSANLPHTFKNKGGIELLEAFRILSHEFANLELVVRARVPEAVKRRFELATNPKIKLIEEEMPWRLLQQEFQTADIFLCPTHETQNFVLLDAMSYELPIVSTAIGGSGCVRDGVTGLVIARSMQHLCPIELRRRGYEVYHLHPFTNFVNCRRAGHPVECSRGVEEFEREIVPELVDKTRRLISDAHLRRSMGERARWETEKGEHSIKKRNETLKRIFDEATGKS